MAYVDWNPAFDTGIPGIDFEHHQLVDLLNRTDEMIRRSAVPQAVIGVLGDFYTLATAHFALEERIMADEAYPGLAERRVIHRRLLDEVREIMLAFQSGAFDRDKSLPEALKTWLSQVMSIDATLFAEIDEPNLHNQGLTRNDIQPGTH